MMHSWMEREYPPFRIDYVSICIGYVALAVVMFLIAQFVIPYPADWASEPAAESIGPSFRNHGWSLVLTSSVVLCLLVIVRVFGFVRLVRFPLRELSRRQADFLRSSELIRQAWDQTPTELPLYDLLPLRHLNRQMFSLAVVATSVGAGVLGLGGPPNENLSPIVLAGLGIVLLGVMHVLTLWGFATLVVSWKLINYLSIPLLPQRKQSGQPAGISSKQTAKSARYRARSATASPYDRIFSKRSGRTKRPFGAFISYSNHNVLPARHLAEQLIAAGRLPWFAEYCIGAERWTTDDRQIAEILSAGIDQSAAGIVLASKHYEKSLWCLKELMQLDEPVAVLELGKREAGPGEVAERLEAVPAAQIAKYSSEEAALAHVCRVLDWDLIPWPSVDHTPRAPDFDATTGWRMQLDGWEYAGLHKSARGDEVPAFERSFRDYRATLNVLAGPVAGESLPMEGESIDDRAYREQLIRFVRRYSKTIRSPISGAHLIDIGGRGHFAVSYRRGNTWIRKYSLNFPLDRDVKQYRKGDVWEFAVTFAFYGPFEEFCRYAWCFDRAVSTFQWHPERATFRFA